MKTIGWAGYVNDFISDETSISAGSKGTISDSDANGFEDTRLTSFVNGKSYSVVMYFNFDGSGGVHPEYCVDRYGRTEFDRFERWYEFEHKKGAVPFWFPSITKNSVDVLTNSDGAGMTLYKIKGGYNATKSGLDMKVTMTFEEVYSGIIQIESEQNGQVDSSPFSADLSQAILRYIKAPAVCPSFDKVFLGIKESGVAGNLTKKNIKRLSLHNDVLEMLFVTPISSSDSGITVYKLGLNLDSTATSLPESECTYTCTVAVRGE